MSELRRGAQADDALCGEIVASAGGAETKAEPIALGSRRRQIAEQAGRAVGFVDYDPASGEIKYLFVRPGAQGRGIGSRLLGAAESELKRPARLKTLADANAALGFYLAQGYVEAGRDDEANWHGRNVTWIRLQKPE